MKKGERKIIFFLLLIIIIFSCILIYKIQASPKYDEKLYDEIYEEYNQLFENDQAEIKEKNNSAISKKDNQVYVKSDKHGKQYRVLGKIIIPKISIHYPIINETSEEYLKIAPTKLYGPEINEVGNFCIVGHNYKNNQFFSRLSELNVGDKVFLTPNNGKDLKYLVYNKYEIEETDMECTNQNTNGNVEITLITCTKDKKKRLVVKCKAVI